MKTDDVMNQIDDVESIEKTVVEHGRTTSEFLEIMEEYFKDARDLLKINECKIVAKSLYLSNKAKSLYLSNKAKVECKTFK